MNSQLSHMWYQRPTERHSLWRFCNPNAGKVLGGTRLALKGAWGPCAHFWGSLLPWAALLSAGVQPTHGSFCILWHQQSTEINSHFEPGSHYPQKDSPPSSPPCWVSSLLRDVCYHALIAIPNLESNGGLSSFHRHLGYPLSTLLGWLLLITLLIWSYLACILHTCSYYHSSALVFACSGWPYASPAILCHGQDLPACCLVAPKGRCED